MERPSKQVVKEGLAGLAARSRGTKRSAHSSHSSTLDLGSTLQKFGYSTGFEVSKYIEEWYGHHPISSSLEQRDELRQRRELVSEALKGYVTNHYQSFISTSAEITTIENDMLKLNHLLGQFQSGLKILSGQNITFTYEDEKLCSKLKIIEKSSGLASGSSSASATNSMSNTGGQHPADFELEELNEELRGWIYERKFEQALATLNMAMGKSRKRAEQLSDERERASVAAAAAVHSNSAATVTAADESGSSASFRLISADLLDLRQTLIEMLFSELRAAATSSSVIGGKAGGGSSAPATGKKGARSGTTQSTASTGGTSVPALQQLISHLVSLKQSKRACNIFLYHVKSTHLRQAIRGIKFSGDILAYIQELSKKFFSGIAATVQEFQRVFLAPTIPELGRTASGRDDGEKHVLNPQALSSYLLRWILHEITNTYNTIFQKQVFQMEGTFSKLGKCLKIAFLSAQELYERSGGGGGGGTVGSLGSSTARSASTAGASVMAPPSVSGVGINLSFILAKMFVPSLADVISRNYKHVENLIHEELNVEVWRVTELWVQEKDRSSTAGGDGSSAAATSRRKDSTASASTQPKRKLALRLTSSAKYLYDVVRNLLRELVPILDNHSYPELRVELYPCVVQGMITLFEGYLLAMAQKLKSGLYDFEELQALSIVANSFYLHTDLLPRVIKEFRKHFCQQSSANTSSGGSIVGSATTIPELEIFNSKLRRLYDALRDSFASKRATFIWPGESYLKFQSKFVGGANKYANPLSLTLSGDLVSISPEWIDFCEVTLTNFKNNVARTLPGAGSVTSQAQASSSTLAAPGDQVSLVVTKALNEFLEGLWEGSWRNIPAAQGGAGQATGSATSKEPSSSPSATSSNFWSTTYLFGLGGLQQFVLDLKYFAVSAGGSSSSSSGRGSFLEVQPGGYLSERAVSSLNLLLRTGVESYANKTGTNAVNREWQEQNFKWIDSVIQKRVQNAKVMNLSKQWQQEKERLRLEREKELEAARASPAAEVKSSSSTSSSSAAARPSPVAAAVSSSSSSNPHASSAIALPQKGVRRGSVITPDQLALMNSVLPISSLDGGKGTENSNRRVVNEEEDDDDDEQEEDDEPEEVED